MAKKVSISEFEKEMIDVLEKYKGQAREAVAEVLPQVGKETVKDLREKSPKNKGDYARGWKYQMDPRRKNKNNSQMVVYNKDHYRLTHLLEKGHAKVNGGRVEGQPHIAPAAEEAEKKALEMIKSKIERI